MTLLQIKLSVNKWEPNQYQHRNSADSYYGLEVYHAKQLIDLSRTIVERGHTEIAWRETIKI
ncbi:hypothetical protein S140_213 [Shewanella sp. phage 1/40]|uniref:hypothetical protein n=1 Tax=Shewanella sp. phage 1/40 TaxID=1458860 RepID=UPI0004F80BD3|nr:hypothetical protein S140_213 [Shewanella sp. phage 1/40]AHK11620.1 hypothetical protein S140_213 [Shewanella sp. phage 1/40]